jgi:hypothetical protein
MIKHQRQRQPCANGVGVGIDMADHADGGSRIQQVGYLLRIDALAHDRDVSRLVCCRHPCPQSRLDPRRTPPPR